MKAGRPDEAGMILQQESVRDFLPAKRLSTKVAKQLVNRAEKRLEQGNSYAGMADLRQAAELGGCDTQVAKLQTAQVERGLQRVQSFLIRGENKLAAEQISRLEQRQLGGSERRVWKQVVQLISQAKELADLGKTTAASEKLERASHLLPNADKELNQLLTARLEQVNKHTVDLRRLTGELHSALTNEAWTEALTAAEAMLELAPEHTAARQARRRAWDAVGMTATQVPAVNRPASRPTGRAGRQRVQQLAQSMQSTHAGNSSAKVDTKAMNRAASKRVVAWIDGVGGYLICLGDEVMLGQPTDSGGADIPILADLSRRHATIRREGEAYVINPIHRVQLNGVELTGPQVLKDNSVIELGETVRLRFRKPHALSSTAVLTLESHHKTEPAVDGIILMSESCVLGAQPQSHIFCRSWTDDLVLFRRGEDLQFRTAAKVELDGEPDVSAGLVRDGTRIDGETFTLSFEEITAAS